MRLGAVVAAAVLIVACSGGDESGEETVAVRAETSSPEVTSSTVAAVTEPSTLPSSTLPPPTAAPTTVSPTTTALDDPERMRAAEEGYLAAWEAYHQAILDPSDPVLRAEVERTYTGPNLEAVTATLDRYVAEGLVAEVNPVVPARAEILQPGLPVPGQPAIVDIVVCEINSEPYFEVGSRPDGGRALIRDEVVALRILVRVENVNETWKLRSGENLSRQSGVEDCSD